MRKFKYIFVALLFIVGLSACENVDFGDTNENLNGPPNGDAAALMTGAMQRYSDVTNRDYLIRPTLYVQWNSQVTYTSEMRYSDVPSSWFIYYEDVLEGLEEVIELNTNPDTQTSALSLQGAFVNQAGVAMIMKAIVAKRLTDTYGPIPYSEALKGTENTSPVFDSGEEVYTTLISELKAGRDMLDASLSGPTGDIIYNGDVTKWKKLANSVLMQMAIQMSDVYPNPGGVAASVFTEALASGPIETIADEAWFTYNNATGLRNPWFANRTTDYFLAQEFTDALKGNVGSGSLNPTSNHTADPRLAAYSKDESLDGVPYGYTDESGSGKNQMNFDFYWDEDASLPMMTAGYTALNRAEAAVLGWTSEVALTKLEDGINLSMESVENHTGMDFGADATTYIAARLVDAGTEGVLQIIQEEKWVCLYPSGFDAWAEWRRSHVPDLQPATDYLNDGTIPSRYVYPSAAATSNEANYLEALTHLDIGSDNNYAKTWWDID